MCGLKKQVTEVKQGPLEAVSGGYPRTELLPKGRSEPHCPEGFALQGAVVQGEGGM